MRRSLQAYIEIGAILGLSYFYEIIFEYTESILACKRIRLKQINILGEYAKNILLYIEITQTDIKLGLTRRIFDQNQINFRSEIIFLYMIEWAIKHLTPLSLWTSF